MKKSELIKQLTEIEGDPHVLIDLDTEDFRCAGVHRSEECYSTYIDPTCTFDKTYVWDLDLHYEDAGFNSQEEWDKFKSNPENRVIILRP